LAIYVPPTRRRRSIIVAALAALVVGVAIGYLLGRSTAEDAGDIIARSHRRAADAVDAVQRLPIEYEQLGAEESPDTLNEAIDSASLLLVEAADASPWLTTEARRADQALLDGLRADVAARTPAPTFAAHVKDVVDAVAARYGVAAPT
jgi:hypothetical protein